MDGADAIRYIVANKIEGVLVECGVESGTYEHIWIQELMKQGLERDIYMYDTFAGLTAPSEHDYNLVNYDKGAWNTPSAVLQTWTNQITDTTVNKWCNCPLEKVQQRLLSTGYPSSRLHYIVGDVLETLKVDANIPEQIAILRLDTDWYESSKFELIQLYDRVVKGGVIIFDDYYFWNGQRKATDEFFNEKGLSYTITKINGQTGAIIKNE